MCNYIHTSGRNSLHDISVLEIVLCLASTGLFRSADHLQHLDGGVDTENQGQRGSAPECEDGEVAPMSLADRMAIREVLRADTPCTAEAEQIWQVILHSFHLPSHCGRSGDPPPHHGPPHPPLSWSKWKQ